MSGIEGYFIWLKEASRRNKIIIKLLKFILNKIIDGICKKKNYSWNAKNVQYL
jgi:TM2 domain-containing membrane protein YozV